MNHVINDQRLMYFTRHIHLYIFGTKQTAEYTEKIRICKEYLEVVGSNMIGTNMFSATTIPMAVYELEDYVFDLNYKGNHLESEVCDDISI